MSEEAKPADDTAVDEKLKEALGGDPVVVTGSLGADDTPETGWEDTGEAIHATFEHRLERGLEMLNARTHELVKEADTLTGGVLKNVDAFLEDEPDLPSEIGDETRENMVDLLALGRRQVKDALFESARTLAGIADREETVPFAARFGVIKAKGQYNGQKVQVLNKGDGLRMKVGSTVFPEPLVERLLYEMCNSEGFGLDELQVRVASVDGEAECYLNAEGDNDCCCLLMLALQKVPSFVESYRDILGCVYSARAKLAAAELHKLSPESSGIDDITGKVQLWRKDKEEGGSKCVQFDFDGGTVAVSVQAFDDDGEPTGEEDNRGEHDTLSGLAGMKELMDAGYKARIMPHYMP